MVTGGWIAWRLSPVQAAWERAAWEQKLYHWTGLVAQIDDVEHPRGGSTLLVHLNLTDPDGGDPVATVRQVEIASTSGGTLVVLSQPEISQAKFLRLCEVLHQRVLRGPAPEATLQIRAGELTLEIGRRSQTFTSVSCTCESGKTGVRTLMEFQLAGREMPAPAQLRIERNRQTIPPTTQWELQSPSPVPCVLFADYLPALEKLGPQCTFQGGIVMTEMSGIWSGRCGGYLATVDLESATESFPHKLSGQASVQIHSASVRQGVLVDAAGCLDSPGGTVSTTLLESLSDQFHLRLPHAAIRLPRPYVRYDALAFDFAMSHEGVSLRGQCAGFEPGTLMRSQEGPLLVADSGRSFPLAALVRALSPASEFLVPATEETRRLLGALAFPASQNPQTNIAERPRARLRQGPPK